MINKLNAVFFAAIILLNIQNVNAQDLEISAKEIELEKTSQIISAEGDVRVTDLKNNIILGTKVKYNKKKQKLNTFGPTKITTSEKFTIIGKDILYDNSARIVSSNSKTKIIDIDGNIIEVSMFNYIVDKNMFLSKGNIIVKDKNKNEYYFSEIYIDEKKRKIVGSDIKAFLNDGSFKNDPRNDPRFFSNSGTIQKDNSVFNKAVFTTCENKNNEKCPWLIRAEKINHNSAKKTIFYNNAVLKIYDFPVFYFPKFFHPDPTVKRQSGFLMPQFANNSTVGFSTSVPYFWAISENKDMTITPKIYTSENILFKNEYRQAFKNSFLIVDTSYTEGYKKTTSKKLPGSQNHIFVNFIQNIFEKENSFSNLEVNLEHVSNDTYLEVHDVNSELVEKDKQILKNEVKYQYQDGTEYFGLTASAFEDLSKSGRSKYEYVAPNLVYERNLFSSEKTGIIDLYTNAIARNNNVNQTTKFLVNEIGWKSKSYISSGGLQNNFEGLLKVVTYEADNTEQYKNGDFNAESYGALAFNSSKPMFKNNLNTNTMNFLTPKLSLRYAPGHMRDIDDDNLRLSYSNLFALNKNSQLDVVESGSSITAGIEFSNQDFVDGQTGAENFSLSIGQVYNFEENFDLPSRSSLDQKASDIVGTATANLGKNFSISNQFSIDHNLNDINYNNLEASFLLGNTSFNLGYLEENNHIGNNSYVKSDIKINLNNSNNLSFDLKKNLETDSTEYYNLAYNYLNDCLKAGLVYRREFYADPDIESTDTLMFSISLLPFGNVNLPSYER